MPTAFYQQTHFVWVRGYDANKCDVGTTGFIPTLMAWQNYFNNITSSIYPRLFVGALSFDNGVSGYVPPDTFPTYVQQAASAVPDRFGGINLWDGTNGETNLDSSGRTFINVTKQAL